MPERFSSFGPCSPSAIGQSAIAFDNTAAADFKQLSGEQIERLIARREAPTMWRTDAEPLHPPEPFGMIA